MHNISIDSRERVNDFFLLILSSGNTAKRHHNARHKAVLAPGVCDPANQGSQSHTSIQTTVPITVCGRDEVPSYKLLILKHSELLKIS